MQTLQAVTPEAFSGKFWKHPGHYLYAAHLPIAPLATAELPKAVGHLPLAFARVYGHWQLVAIMALQQGVNLLIGPQGQWLGSYVPAVLRAYPFTLRPVQDGSGQTLCTSLTGEHIVSEGQGEAFFNEDNKPSDAILRVMNFLIEVDTGRIQIQRAINALDSARLLSPWDAAAEYEIAENKLTGLFRLNVDAFSKLKSKAFSTLHAEGALPVAYAQLYSGEHFANLKRAAAIQERLRASDLTQDNPQTEIQTPQQNIENENKGNPDLL